MNVADDAVGQFALQRAAKSTSADLQWKTLWSSQQTQAGLAIAYQRPEVSGRRTTLENLGMPDRSRVEIYNSSLTVSKYIGVGSAGTSGSSTPTPRPTQNEWLPLWTSDSAWRVTGYTVGDIDGDGQSELVYTLWKNSLTWQRPSGGGMLVNMQGGDILPHIYINGWRRGQMSPVWQGSPRPAPALAVAVAPLGKAGKPILAVLESADKSVEKAPGKVSLWQWSGGFGFELASQIPGTYSTMWSDGKVLLFK